MFKIVSDSSCDLLSLDGVDFASVPLTISTESRSWVDDSQIDVHEMLDALAVNKGRTFTACPNVDAWLKAFEGSKEIIAATITSGLSGTYSSAMAARSIYLQQHPDAKIHVLDSLSTGPELALLLEKLAEYSRSGFSVESAAAAAEAYLKTTRLFFVLQSIRNLAQNGRVSKAVAAAVGVLGVRIVATASRQGTIEPIAKLRNDKKAVAELLAQLEQMHFHKGKLRITHAENSGLAEQLRRVLAERYPQADLCVYESRGLCSYYAERGAVFLAAESC